jgi:hypothetical protein
MPPKTKIHFDWQTTEVTELTPYQAEQIRLMRVVKNYTWRMVAKATFDQFDADWKTTPSSQIVGMELCKVAAEHFGEDYKAPPWN